jgi:hypothetical protein
MRLSPREMEVARLVAEDLTDKEIANILRISIRTVQQYLDRIARKIGANESEGHTSPRHSPDGLKLPRTRRDKQPDRCRYNCGRDNSDVFEHCQPVLIVSGSNGF